MNTLFKFFTDLEHEVLDTLSSMKQTDYESELLPKCTDINSPSSSASGSTFYSSSSDSVNTSALSHNPQVLLSAIPFGTYVSPQRRPSAPELSNHPSISSSPSTVNNNNLPPRPKTAPTHAK